MLHFSNLFDFFRSLSLAVFPFSSSTFCRILSLSSQAVGGCRWHLWFFVFLPGVPSYGGR